MLRYLAQGAGMPIEDAALAQAPGPDSDVPTMLQRYTLNRWRRNARVQARSLRNGGVFHAAGMTRWGRNTAMKLLGKRVLDLPWLYGAGSKKF